MSKIIKLTQDVIDEMRADFDKAMETMKLSDGKFTFSRTLGKIDRKAELVFTEKAYIKMCALVQDFDKEVAWHGLAKRGDDTKKDEYIIYDILVYPQEVTDTNVNTDQEKYQTWLMEREDDEFGNIRMQGHSHVNMGTTPSGVDTTLYDQILEQLEEDMFYIFLIWNKRDERTIKIYDIEKNVLFETDDIEVFILEDMMGLDSFLADAKQKVQLKTYAAVIPSTKGGNKTESSANSTTSSTGKKKKKKKAGSTASGGFKDYEKYYDKYDDIYTGGYYPYKKGGKY